MAQNWAQAGSLGSVSLGEAASNLSSAQEHGEGLQHAGWHPLHAATLWALPPCPAMTLQLARRWETQSQTSPSEDPPCVAAGCCCLRCMPVSRGSCCGRGGSSSRRLDFCPLSHFPQIPGEGPGSFSPCPAGKNRCVPCATSTSPVPPASNLQEPPASTCPVLPAFPVGDPPVFEPCWGAGANHPWETTTKSPNSFKAKPNLPLSPPKNTSNRSRGNKLGSQSASRPAPAPQKALISLKHPTAAGG